MAFRELITSLPYRALALYFTLRNLKRERRSIKDEDDPMSVRSCIETDISDEPMCRKTLLEVIALLGELDHIPFAVCGLAAMIYHGFKGEHARRVTVLCPASAKHIISCWARVRDMYASQEDPNTLGIRTSDGVFRRVRIEFLESGFESWEREQVPGTRSYVLSLPSMANDIALGYIQELEKYGGEKQGAFRRCMTWTLGEMIHRGITLAPQRAPAIYNANFWTPFTLSFTEMKNLFHQVGVGIDEYGGLLRGDRYDSNGHQTAPPIPPRSPHRLSRKPGMIFTHGHESKEASSMSEHISAQNSLRRVTSSSRASHA